MTVPAEIKAGGASCSVWTSGVPRHRSLRTAAVGRLSCDTPSSGRRILGLAEEAARDAGMQCVVGPMDRTTWHSYRLVTESDGTPPFLFEPDNPGFCPSVFLDSGFGVVGAYCSALDHDLSPKGSERYAERVRSRGIRVRDFDPSNAERDLRLLHRISVRAFARNFLYTGITEDEFLGLYRPVLPRVAPRYVQMAEDPSGEPVAFFFAIPDFAQGPRPDRLIFKTYASTYPGMGRHLLERTLARGRDDGFTAVIHALMHDDNPSRNTSRKHASVFRRYALYGKVLR